MKPLPGHKQPPVELVTDYERAIVEKMTVAGQRVLRILPVDDTGVLTESGFPVWCWNALSSEQHRHLIGGGNANDITRPEGHGCDQLARALIEVVGDESPGPRLYCLGCGGRRLVFLAEQERWNERKAATT